MAPLTLKLRVAKKAASKNWALFRYYFRRRIRIFARDRRCESRVLLSPHSDCTLAVVGGEELYSGQIIDLSPGGVKFVSEHAFANDSVLEITFYDDIEKRKVSFFATVLCDPSVLFTVSKYEISVWQHRCRTCPDLEVPVTYKNFYQRALADSYVQKAQTGILAQESYKMRGYGIEFKLAESIADKEQAYRLVYKEYIKRKFTDPNPFEIYTYIYQLLSSTATINGLYNGEVGMTISTVCDSPFKLPMDRMFQDVIEPLRQDGRKLVEFSMLATCKKLFPHRAYSLMDAKKLSCLFTLFRFAVQYSMHAFGATDILIAIPPRYEKLYQYLCFDKLSQTP